MSGLWIGAIGRLWSIARKVEELFELHGKVRDSLKLIEERLRALEDRMIRLETEQAQIITEAKTAATAASTIIVGNVIADTVTRLTRLEGRADHLDRRLPPPN
jgi:hypothetical protein